MEPRTAPNPGYGWRTRRQQLALVVVFAATLLVPFVGTFLNWQGAALVENRHLAAAPDFGRAKLAELPAKIDAFLRDHVGFRGLIVRGSGVLLHQILGESAREVVVGKLPAASEPRWYFYAGYGLMEDRMGRCPLSPAQLEAFRTSLEHRRTWLARRGIAYLVVIAPEKSSVYPEYLPDSLRRHMGATRLDQLSAYLTAARLPFLDLRPALAAAKTGGPLYFAQDTHWTGRGYLVAYQTIVHALGRTFPDLEPGELGREFQIWLGPETARTDLASMLGLRARTPAPLLAMTHVPARAPSSWPPGVDPARSAIEGVYALQSPGRKRRLLVFHDSFFAASSRNLDNQPLAMHFSRSYFAWLSPSGGAFRRFVEMERPDVVVEEHCERDLRRVPVPGAPLDSVTARLSRVAGVPAFALERINGRRAMSGDAFPAVGDLRLEGWAFDRSTHRPAGGVEIVIDGVPYPASYGMERSAAANAPSLSGFQASIPLDGLRSGRQEITVRVISADGRSYEQAAWGSFIRLPNGVIY